MHVILAPVGVGALEPPDMSRPLRFLLLGSMAIALGYLLVHAREPLRLNIGDPWSDANVLTSINYVKSHGFLATSFTDILDVGPLTADSYRYIHYPPLSEIFYGAVGKYLGVSDIGTFRLFGLAFSTLAMWLLYSYVRRLYTPRIALIATALFSTSLLWMMYADSMHQAPLMQCTGFLALWGLVRALETGQRRHQAAAFLGAFACFFTSYDYYLFLPAAVLFTIYVKRGNPLAHGNRRFVAICAAGCLLGVVVKSLAVIGAVGWHEFLADLNLQFFERATSTHDRKFSSAIPTMIRRITLVLTPLAWITIAYHALKALRAPTVTVALRDTAAWMLVVALAFLYVFSQLAGSQMLASQVLLPFYAIGSALVIDRLLDGDTLRRRLAFGWLVVAPLWSFALLFTQPRAVLDRGDVARANAYLASHDRNDFLLTNVMSDGHIQAMFQRHAWGALDAIDTSESRLDMLRILDRMGTDYVHAAIFTTPESRFIDKSLWPLALPRSLWAVTGWPHLNRAKANQLIREYDGLVMKNLAAIHAEKVLHLGNFDLYRIDRTALMERARDQVPVVAAIDLGSLNATRHKLLGWSKPRLAPDEAVGVSRILGYRPCQHPVAPGDGGAPRPNACKTVLTNLGVTVKDAPVVVAAQLMIRVERSCELRLTATFAAPALVALSMNGVRAVPAVPVTQAALVVPEAAVHPGINVLTLENLVGALALPADVSGVAIDPACPAP